MRRFEAWTVCLDPTVRSEMKKNRPGVIVSPDELNAHLKTVVIVPLTAGRSYPFRVRTQIANKEGVAAIDQMLTVDKSRLVKKLGKLDKDTQARLLKALRELFSA